MNTRNKLILGLAVAGVVLLGAVYGVILPWTSQDKQLQVSDGQNPLTQDFESIAKYKNKYMGNASNIGNLFHSLPLNDTEMSFQLYTDTLTAEIFYKSDISEIGGDMVDRALIYNATAAFALIENLDAVKFSFEDISYRALRADVEKWYGIGLQALAGKEIWAEKVQSKLSDEEYVKSCIKAIITQAGERTPVAEALMDFYENTEEPIVVYEQMPFENGTLVLAEKLTDGEHYPELYFIDAGGSVAYLTSGSYCWTLNYTQFKGCSIYFGLAGVEARRYSGDQSPVKKVEALISGKAFGAAPGEGIIAHINSMEKDTRLFKNPQGYIMAVKDSAMPVEYTAVLEDGSKLSLSQEAIKRGIDNMPDYLRSNNPEVYTAFAFTFTPMLTPIEWDKGYREGEICLEGKTDQNGNRNALYLRPTGHMSHADSFILPLDMKSLYLSDNYPRTAGFSAGETVAVKYPEGRKLVDCRILGLTRDKVEKGIGQDRFAEASVNEMGQLQLPKGKGYYLFLLRTEENKEIQTYTGMFVIK